MQMARRPFAANLLRELPSRKDVTAWYPPKSSCGQWLMAVRNKSSETSTENANFEKGLIGIFLGYTLWLRKGRRILVVKEQLQPFLGSSSGKIQSSRKWSLIYFPTSSGVSRERPQVTMKWPRNHLQSRNCRQELQKDIFHAGEIKHSYSRTWKTIELKCQGVASM